MWLARAVCRSDQAIGDAAAWRGAGLGFSQKCLRPTSGGIAARRSRRETKGAVSKPKIERSRDGQEDCGSDRKREGKAVLYPPLACGVAFPLCPSHIYFLLMLVEFFPLFDFLFLRPKFLSVLTGNDCFFLLSQRKSGRGYILNSRYNLKSNSTRLNSQAL